MKKVCLYRHIHVIKKVFLLVICSSGYWVGKNFMQQWLFFINYIKLNSKNKYINNFNSRSLAVPKLETSQKVFEGSETINLASSGGGKSPERRKGPVTPPEPFIGKGMWIYILNGLACRQIMNYFPNKLSLKPL